MKSLLAKFPIRKFVGLYLGEHEVSVSEVAVTPLGPVETSSHTETCSPSELLNVIERVLQSLQGRKQRRLQVAVGLPNSRVFFGTRTLRGTSDSSPENMMQKLLCSSNVTVNDLTIDMLKSTVDKMPVASVAACRKKYLAAVLGVLQRCGAQVLTTEPAPCALVRAASREHRPPRRAKTLVWIFLGAAEGLAVLTVAGLPLAWRSFALPALSEGMAILSATRTLLSQSRYYGMETPLEYAIVHGRPELHERLQKEGLPTEVHARIIWHDGPELSGAATAFGLAIGCLNQTASAFDLSRMVKPRASLRDIFPWGELVVQCALMILMALILARQDSQSCAAYTAARLECGQNKILASSNVADLEREKKSLADKINALHQFLDSRVTWTSYFRDVANRLPPTIRLCDFQGSVATDTTGKGGARKSLRFSAAVRLLPRGAVPPEVFKLVASLRGDPTMKRNFPSVELGNIQPGRDSGAKDDKGTNAGFTIVCQTGK
jgi:hypothetical protein